MNLQPCVSSEPAHSPFGGSVATRILRCPASVGLVAKVPAHLRKSSAYADRGTALHAAMALLDRARMFASTTSLAQTIDNYTITRDDIENALRPVLAYVDALLDAPGAEYYLEQRVAFPDHRRRLRYLRPDRPHRQHYPRDRFQIRQPACAFSRFIPTATRTSSTRSFCSTPRLRATRSLNSSPASSTSS